MHKSIKEYYLDKMQKENPALYNYCQKKQEIFDRMDIERQEQDITKQVTEQVAGQLEKEIGKCFKNSKIVLQC